jgi:ADP-ribosylglycohydrolase
MAGFRRAHHEAPRGAWSDDGAQALCLLASLLHCGQLDINDLGRRLVNWYEQGYMAVDGVVFDIGIQTTTALRALREGTAAESAGPSEEHNNGNGSLMRVLPLALWHRGSDEELARDAARQSIVTHGHPRSQLCCALYCLWARATAHGRDDAWSYACLALRQIFADRSEWMEEIDHLRLNDAPGGTGTGYVVDCLHSARLALEEPSYERIIQRAVAIGIDTDTTAAVAGGIAGLHHGLSAIPQRWLEVLSGRELVEPLAQQLVERLRD